MSQSAESDIPETPEVTRCYDLLVCAPSSAIDSFVGDAMSDFNSAQLTVTALSLQIGNFHKSNDKLNHFEELDIAHHALSASVRPTPCPKYERYPQNTVRYRHETRRDGTPHNVLNIDYGTIEFHEPFLTGHEEADSLIMPGVVPMRPYMVLFSPWKCEHTQGMFTGLLRLGFIEDN